MRELIEIRVNAGGVEYWFNNGEVEMSNIEDADLDYIADWAKLMSEGGLYERE